MSNVNLLTIASINANCMKNTVKQKLINEFIAKNSIDILCLQEVNVERFDTFKGFEFFGNTGKDLRGTGFIYRTGYNISEIMCSEDGRITSAKIQGVRIVNVYAPSGSQNESERNIFFNNSILPFLNFDSPLLFIGDFNCIIRESDSRNKSKICKSLLRLTQNLNFVDIWCMSHKNQIEFTYCRQNCASRIDRAYCIKKDISLIHRCEINPVSFSDHNALFVYYKVDIRTLNSYTKHGWGYWKVKKSLLIQEHVDKFRNIVKDLKKHILYSQNIVKWWFEVFKKRAKAFFKNLEIEKATHHKNMVDFYHSVLLQLNQEINKGKNLSEEFKEIKCIIRQLKQKQLDENFINKNKDNTNEVYNLYYLMRQIKNKQHLITFLENDKQEILTNTMDILSYAQKYLQNQFKKGETDDKKVRCLLAHVNNKINSQDIECLKNDINKEELYCILKQVNRKKTPGVDGLSYEFYLAFFDEIGDEMVSLFNKFLIQGTLPPTEFSEGIVTLIPKIKKARSLDSFRPITLLNCDYKLIMKIIARRVQNLSTDLFGKEQTCANDHSSIFNNLMMIRDAVLINEDLSVNTALLSLDFNKAFDRVNHEYLWKICRKIGMPENLLNFIKNTYQHASSKVMINGYLSKSVIIDSSVRQGCPFSMFLFSISIEPLIRLLNFVVEGCTLNNQFVKVSAYADDIVVYLKNKNDLHKTMQIISIYEGATNARLSIEKTFILQLGLNQNSVYHNQYNILIKNEIKILGMLVKANFNSMVQQNWEKVLGNIKNMLFINTMRNLDLIMKIKFVNEFVLSKVWYLAQILPITHVVAQKIVKHTGNFIWMGSMYRISREQLYLSHTKGGLNLINVERKAHALFLKTQSNSWVTIKNKITYKSSVNCIFEGKDMFARKKYFKDITKTLRENHSLVNKNELTQTKTVYNTLLEKNFKTPGAEIKYPNFDWKIIWCNILNNNLIPTQWKASTYKALNDIYPVGKKLKKHNLSSDDKCIKCGIFDDVEHRIKTCGNAKHVWYWIKSKIKDKFGIDLKVSIGIKTLVSTDMVNKCDKNVWLWLLCSVIYYNLEIKGSLEYYLEIIRLDRYNKIRYGQIDKFSNKIFFF